MLLLVIALLGCYSASAADTCSQGQYSTSFSSPTCIPCAAGTYRSINSAPVPDKGEYGPWYPMRFT
jgi:hypothetical protein